MSVLCFWDASYQRWRGRSKSTWEKAEEKCFPIYDDYWSSYSLSPSSPETPSPRKRRQGFADRALSDSAFIAWYASPHRICVWQQELALGNAEEVLAAVGHKMEEVGQEVGQFMDLALSHKNHLLKDMERVDAALQQLQQVSL
jgi:hypothetical protein